MKKPPIVYLNHILECISRINTYVEDVDENVFLKDSLIQDAVIRNFEVIGEAVKKLDHDFLLHFSLVPLLRHRQAPVQTAV